MEITGLILAIVILGFIIRPQQAAGALKSIGLPKWAKKKKSSDKWMINGKEVLGKVRVVKWLLLALMKLALLILSFFGSLLKVAFSSSKTLLPSSLKK